ncbi:hypothetical protein [Mammaliicoccus sciuri]|uniref:hypothetical protein n=1 Tax=Mammaliicoccus sciuri TaxID=1296 RepID=UPI0034DD178C
MRKTYKILSEEKCGIGHAMYMVGGKWKLIILYYLLLKEESLMNYIRSGIELLKLP